MMMRGTGRKDDDGAAECCCCWLLVGAFCSGAAELLLGCGVAMLSSCGGLAGSLIVVWFRVEY